MNMKKQILVLTLLAMVSIALWTQDVGAYEFYSSNINNVGNCADCHQGFRETNPYTSPKDNGDWGDSLHNIHLNNIIGGSIDCDWCHNGANTRTTTGATTRKVNLGDSAAAVDGVNAISCDGCHGRLGEGGAGLRQHHANAGITECYDCHADATPVGENTMPAWYSALNLDPCNAINRGEDFAGSIFGLDNDGDNAYDGNDTDCARAQQPQCGDGNLDAGEQCDDGAANGTTTCGCQLNCTYTTASTSCDDGLFCTVGETCNGTGVCDGGSPNLCSDGVGCTNDSCDETANVCISTPVNANCSSDGLFCNGIEFCDPIADCSSAGDPCQPGTICSETTDTCAQQPQCGDGNLDAGEQCDDGAANGTTTCGCQLNCTYTPSGSACGDQGVECLVDDTCDGAGACTDNGSQPDGTSCGNPSDTQCDNPDSCLAGSCEPNYEPVGLICDDGAFCTVGDACNGTGLCTSGPNSPCLSGETCDEANDVCVAAVVDLDIARFSAIKNVRLARVKPVEIKLVVENNGTANAQSRPATVTGTQNGAVVFEETQQVVADRRSTFEFGPYTPVEAGDIIWTVTIFDDDPDDDTATTATKVQ